MEDILASIKRIIAEDVESGGPVRTRRRPVPAPTPVEDFDEDDDVLELSEQAPEPVAVEPVAPEPVADPAPMPMSQPVAETPAENPAVEAIVSAQTAEASRAPLDTLSKLVVKPEVPGADTLEGLVREMLKPMLSAWLDRNLPELVESMVAKEIARITGGR
jgi:cell pole-organizing protein PopZ